MADSKLNRASELRRKMDRGEIAIEYACRDRVTLLKSWVKKVLTAIGHPEAFVTNQSMVSDFLPSGIDNTMKNNFAKELGEKLGIRVDLKDYIVDVAQKLRLNNMH